jgi:DNA-binding GntR family transcriptional regulator
MPLTPEPRTATAHEYARKHLRRAIIDGHLPGGTHLRQERLAKELGLSTTPIREALRDLATEGLVVFVPQHGAVVRELRLADVKEIYELRKILEPLAIRQSLGHLAAADFAQAHDLLVRMDRESDTVAWARLNWEFHGVFIRPIERGHLGQILGKLRDSASLYVGVSLEADPSQIARSRVDHYNLLATCRAGDVAQAIAITVAHLQETVDAIERSQQRWQTNKETSDSLA